MTFSKLLKKAFFDEYWVCAIRLLESEETVRLTDDTATYRYQPVHAGWRHWCADPFLVEHDEKTYLFCEIVRHGQKRASIGCAVVENGRVGRIRPVINASYHLSYPAVFHHNGRFYMVPESRPSKTLTLWRATDFPSQWEQFAILLENREIADATPYWDGRSWVLFIYEPDDENNRRTLYTAPLDLENGTLGSLKKRAVFAEKTGRPAGFPIRIGSHLILPTQLGVRHYGEAIAYREIIINSHTFAERDCGRLSPACVRVSGYPHISGIHTINRLGNLEVIDIHYRRFAPFRVFHRIFERGSQ